MLATLVALLSPAAASGQVVDGIGFSAADGLPTAPVTALAVDGAGRLWAGTSGGLRLLAGDRFVVEQGMVDAGALSPVHQEEVTGLAAGPAGELWVATAGTLHRRDPGGSWSEGVGAEVGLESGVSAVTVAADGAVWAGGENSGLVRFDGEWTTIDPSFRVVALTTDGDGRVWATGGREGAIVVVDVGGPGERVFELGTGELTDATPQVLTVDLSGDVWLGTSNGLVRYRNGSVAEVFGQDSGLGGMGVEAIAADPEDGVWVGTPAGLARVRPGSVDFSIGASAGLGGERIRATTVDSTGDVWAGTSTGLFKLPVRSWVREGTPLDGFVAALGETESGTPFVAIDGTLQIDRGGWIEPEGLDGRIVTTATATGNDTLLVGTETGWGEVRRGVFQPDERCCFDRVNRLLEDSSGRIWVGTNQGLTVVDDNGVVEVFRKTSGPTGLGQDPVTDLWIGTDQTVWVGTLNGGLTPFEGLAPKDRITVQTTGGAFPSDLVDVVTTTAFGDVWVGTKAGLSRRADGEWHSFEEVALSGGITAILEGEPGRVWVGTEADGLLLVDCSATQAGACLVSAFDEGDGLASRRVTSLAWRGGDLWIGTARGVTRHRLDRLSPSLSLGRVTSNEEGGRFLEFRPNELVVDGTACGPGCADELLPHDARAVDVGLIGFDLADPGGLRFEVTTGAGSTTIVGVDDYRQLLEEGSEYALTAVAFDRHLNRSAPVSVDFSTAPTPIPLRPWFWAVIVGGAALVAVIGWWRWSRRDVLAYRTAEVSVESDGDGYRVAVAVDGRSATQRQTTIDVGLLDGLHDRFRCSELVGPDLLATFGETLYRPILDPDAEKALGLRRRRPRPIRLSLDFAQAPELEGYPWEVVHGGVQLEHVVAVNRFAIARRVGTEHTPPQSKVEGPLRVLVAWATPSGMEFNAEREVQTIIRAVEESDAADRIDVTPLAHVRREQLSEAFDDDVDVFHFIGHGDMRDSRPVLLFEGPDRDAHPIDLSMLAAIFGGTEARTRKPRLAVLSACRSAAPGAAGGAIGLAAGLVREGVVAAAVGMGYDIYSDAAAAFSGSLYASLIRHGQIEHAVAVARGALRVEALGARDWVIPRLYAGDLSAAAYDFTGGRT